MTRSRPRRRLALRNRPTPRTIRYHGALYRRTASQRKEAQLQSLLQAFETLAGKMGQELARVKKSLQDAYKAAMGKQFDMATKVIHDNLATSVKVLVDGTKELQDDVNTMVGIEGMGGGA